MKVTEVRITPVKSGNGSTKAYASINLDGVFAVNDIRVIEGKKGLFISLPNRKGKDKDGNEKYYDIAFPTTAELRKEISDAVIAKYNETSQSQPQPNTDGASQPADEDDPFSGVAGWE